MTSVDENETSPKALPLIKSYPNPFNPTTTIEFNLPKTGMTSLTTTTSQAKKSGSCYQTANRQGCIVPLGTELTRAGKLCRLVCISHD